MKTISQIVLLAVLLTVGFVGWHYKDALPLIGVPEKEEARKGRRGGRAVGVITASVRQQDLPRIVTAVGTLQAFESVDVTAKVTAKVEKILFEEGVYVERGSSLLQLDATEPRAELAESQAELVNSRKLYERSLKLLKSGNTPKARVDLLLSEMQVAEAKVAANKARLNDYVIRAPFSGMLGFKDVSAGALVRPADIITTLDDISSLKLDFDLPERNFANIRVGQIFEAISVAYPGEVFNGEVRTISTRIDPVTRAVQIRGRVPNEESRLKPGMFLSVQLQTGVMKDAILVPEQSVIISAAGHFVFEVEEGVARRRSVKIGDRIRGWAQVVTGLEPTSIVITEGLQKVRDGQKVKIVEEEKTEPSAQAGKAFTQ
ncbi:MAG: efflux RND transporter periplasmic adaptor subunit [Sneathiella sp.]